jgi:hypothetical protein
MTGTIAEVRPILERTPGVLRAMLGGADAALAERPYGPGTWSAKEVVAHLVFAERTDWLPRARHILSCGDARPFEPFDRAGHAPLMGRALPELLDLFERERAAGLEALDALALTPADLGRAGLHPALGPVTLGQLLATWAVHDLNHVSQVAKAMAHQLRGAVGPWEAYLSVLAPPAPR